MCIYHINCLQAFPQSRQVYIHKKTSPIINTVSMHKTAIIHTNTLSIQSNLYLSILFCSGPGYSSCQCPKGLPLIAGQCIQSEAISTTIYVRDIIITFLNHHYFQARLFSSYGTGFHPHYELVYTLKL